MLTEFWRCFDELDLGIAVSIAWDRTERDDELDLGNAISNTEQRRTTTMTDAEDSAGQSAVEI